MAHVLPVKPSKSAFIAPTADEGVHGPSVVRQSSEDRERWQAWSESSSGVFVHWGISATLGGLWKGKHIEGLAEWIQYKAKIPFAMYHSHASAYNVVDATPFHRDPLAEIAQVCAEYGILRGIYYSQTIDWEDPDAVGPSSNSWDFEAGKGDFHRYWRRKAAPQLREILRNYGDIGMLWFDMPSGIPAECAQQAFELVRELQPGAVINSRLGGGVDADYNSMDDNYFNNFLPSSAWETAATTNDC